MAEVTGPITTLPGNLHDLPDGTPCDDHPDRLAVARIQGETDSFGCEMHDMCAECLAEHRAQIRAAEAEVGRCDWCGKDAAGLRETRDYDEGLCGPVYQVCASCRQRRDKEAEAYLAAHDDGYWDDDEDTDWDDQPDPHEECGRWDQRANGLSDHCRDAGTEFCQFECPYGQAEIDPQPVCQDGRGR